MAVRFDEPAWRAGAPRRHAGDSCRYTSEPALPGCPPLVLAEAIRQLAEYFRGDRTTFDLPLATGGTPFQQQVWNALMRIPYGATASYGDVARWIRRPDAVRAVGAANGANPIAIVVPCHRVIGADGRLVGYGGGLERKRWLMAHEGFVRDCSLRRRTRRPC